MTTTTQYPDVFVPAEEAREHSELSPEFSDGGPVDPEAPWGRKSDGSPRAKPGRPSGTPDSQPRTRTRRTRVAAAPQRRSARPRQAKQQQGPDYRPGIMGMLQLVAAPLALAGIKNPAFALDAASVTVHAEPLAEAIQQTAEQNPPFAAVLDKVLSAGPYGALLAAVMPLAVQVAANHRLIPPAAAEAMGAMTPEQLMAQVQGDG